MPLGVSCCIQNVSSSDLLQVAATFLLELEGFEERLEGGRLPKVWLPMRLMISKNIVGRSCSGLVKS